MVDKDLIKQLNKKFSDSFANQKQFIKKVLAGKVTQCPQCHQPINIVMDDKSGAGKIKCAKQCTDVELELS